MGKGLIRQRSTLAQPASASSSTAASISTLVAGDAALIAEPTHALRSHPAPGAYGTLATYCLAVPVQEHVWLHHHRMPR
jgi:hypothetical protein